MHIESGLGNQMLDYCDLLAEKSANPTADIYIENIVYDIKGACEKICMWNGYELERVFGINVPNVKDLFSIEQWKRIIQYVNDSEFWNDNWRYSDSICNAFQNEGLILNNVYSRPHENEIKQRSGKFAKTLVGYTLKRHLFKLFKNHVVSEREMYIKNDSDDYTGHTLQFCYKKRNIEKIDRQIREAFVFPQIEDEYNRNMISKIQRDNSVAVHVRRGDMLSANRHYYEYGYIKRAVSFLKRKLEYPVFYFFCDFDSIDWVIRNMKVFGIDREQDKIVFAFGNSGKNSFRDMHLMSQCKHNIITNSSFGFWGAYLNNNKDKITCSPDIRINTTHTF